MSATAETTEVLFARYGPRYRIYVTVIALLGTISAIVTSTTVNVALPNIMGAFGIGQDRGQWIVTGFLAGQTVGQLLSAWLIDSFGQRKTFVVGLCVFVVSVLVAALSPDDLTLVAARVIQGLIAGVLQSLTMYTLFSVFPPEKRGMAMGFFSINAIFGPAVGPTVGGILIEHFDWRAVFYMGLPFSVVGILLGSLLMPEREETAKRAHFDWLGFALLCTTMSCLLTGLSNGQREGWSSDFVLGSLAVAAGAGIAFLVWELHVPQPLVHLRVLAVGPFAAAACVAVVFGIGQFGTTYLIPLFVQTVQGLSMPGCCSCRALCF
jgi:DHA2 family multidrug resistance protein